MRHPLSPRWTVRLRLTVIYTVVLIVAGAGVLAVSYALVDNSLHRSGTQGRTAADRLARGAPPPLGSQTQRAALKARIALIEQAQRQLADDTLGRLVDQYLVALGILIALAATSSWLLAGRVLRPLQRITATLHRVSDARMDERVGLTGPHDELKELGDTFDEMLARLERTFNGQRAFMANASHELRTPLAIMQAENDVLRATPRTSPQALSAVTRTFATALERSERIISDLLTLARSDARDLGREAVDLGALLNQGVAGIAPAARGRRIDVETDIAAARVLGDRGLLESLVENLLVNAVRHNQDGGWIRVSSADTDNEAWLEIANGGSRLAADEMAVLTEPFRRGRARQADVPGHGLGLSLVASIAEAHGGTVSFDSPAEGGLRVRVVFPRVPSSETREPATVQDGRLRHASPRTPQT
jgi:signal transduction histidine kinase